LQCNTSIHVLEAIPKKKKIHIVSREKLTVPWYARNDENPSKFVKNVLGTRNTWKIQFSWLKI